MPQTAHTPGHGPDTPKVLVLTHALTCTCELTQRTANLRFESGEHLRRSLHRQAIALA